MEQGGGVAEPPQGKLTALNRDLDLVKDEMQKNMNKILSREENAFKLLHLSAEMKAEAERFEKTSKEAARSYCWKNAKLIVVIVVVVLVIVLIIILLATEVIPVSALVSPTVTPTSKP